MIHRSNETRAEALLLSIVGMFFHVGGPIPMHVYSSNMGNVLLHWMYIDKTFCFIQKRPC